jgi:hypothetical protein
MPIPAAQPHAPSCAVGGAGIMSRHATTIPTPHPVAARRWIAFMLTPLRASVRVVAATRT